MTFTPLTRAQFEAIPEPMRNLRRANWQRIVRELGQDHHTRYHAAAARNALRSAT